MPLFIHSQEVITVGDFPPAAGAQGSPVTADGRHGLLGENNYRPLARGRNSCALLGSPLPLSGRGRLLLLLAGLCRAERDRGAKGPRGPAASHLPGGGGREKKKNTLGYVEGVRIRPRIFFFFGGGAFQSQNKKRCCSIITD